MSTGRIILYFADTNLIDIFNNFLGGIFRGSEYFYSKTFYLKYILQIVTRQSIANIHNKQPLPSIRNTQKFRSGSRFLIQGPKERAT